ncbi:hypothetical protein J2S43_001056 [Catenuloplanes nepalensis]|uniref:DUF5753 domain-containing protein n=1 Tax=Catenuloplanes nepalensis TaxID=587533 RepID=A0ABT9MMD6_9ACTN|nr:Scr1 family TA system antitoxin-like transcriptional regulator [Catenuloplanes nepalensis]MDP9792544.1 hypothetical protein [Catenuloplanes nepalensis]
MSERTPPPIGAELRWMRQAAGLSGPKLAAAMRTADPDHAVSQSKASRMESGAYSARRAEVHLWRAVCLDAARERAADLSLSVAAHRDVLVAIARMESPEYIGELDRLVDGDDEALAWPALYRGAAGGRAGHEQLFQTARQAFWFAPLTVPSPLLPDAPAPGCPGRLLITPHALNAAAGDDDADPSAVRQHLARLVDAGDLEVLILPRAAGWPYPPQSPFAIYHPRTGAGVPTVVIDTYSVQIRLSEAADISDHHDVFKALATIALPVTPTALIAA